MKTKNLFTTYSILFSLLFTLAAPALAEVQKPEEQSARQTTIARCKTWLENVFTQTKDVVTEPAKEIVQRTRTQLTGFFIDNRDKQRNRIITGTSLVMAAVMGATIAVSVAPRPIHGTVESAQWTQTVRLERLEPETFSIDQQHLVATYGSVPSTLPARDGGAAPRLVECDSTLGTCFYEANHWHTTDSQVLTGSPTEPAPTNTSWSNIDVPSDGRLVPETTYSAVIEFTVDGQTHHLIYTPQSVEQFNQLTPGQHIEVEVSPLHEVTNIQIRGQQ